MTVTANRLETPDAVATFPPGDAVPVTRAVPVAEAVPAADARSLALPAVTRIPLQKIRGAGHSYLVVNAAWHQLVDPTGLVRSACSPRYGLTADGLAYIHHLGLGQFMLRTFGPRGRRRPPSVSALTCCALAIRNEYGYRQAELVHDGVHYLVALAGGRVETSVVAPAPRQPCRLGAWRAFRVDLGGANVVLVRADAADPPASICPARTVAAERRVTVMAVLTDGRLHVRGLAGTVEPTHLVSAAGAVAATSVGRSLGIGADGPLRLRYGRATLTVDALDGPPVPAPGASRFRLTSHATTVLAGDYVWATPVEPTGRRDDRARHPTHRTHPTHPTPTT
jgi:hypothetical protein